MALAPPAIRTWREMAMVQRILLPLSCRIAAFQDRFAKRILDLSDQ
jgi:hypothetical protein